MRYLVLLLCGVAAPAWADRVDVELLLYHAEVHPETGEPCGGAFAGPGLTQLNIFFDNIEFNARDEQERWPERAFPRIEPGDGGRLSVTLDWSPGNLGIGLEPGIQSNYAVRIGWTDRDVLASDRIINLPPHRIVSPRRHYITRDGWTTVNPGNDLARHGVVVCNRPPAPITTTSIFEDIEPGSVFLGWRHTGGLGDAHDWSRVEVFLEPQPELPRFGQPVFTQAAWGSTVTTVRGLDCGRYYACYRSVDDYGHVWEGCDGEIEVERCVEPDMAVPDMGVPDMAVPDMEIDMAPDMEIDMAPDMEIDMAPDMPVLMPDMGPPIDMAPPPVDMAVDMAPPPVDMAPPPIDMAPPPIDMAPPPIDMAVDMAPPPVDMAPPPIDMASPPVDMASQDMAPVDMAPIDMAADVPVSPPVDMAADVPVSPSVDMAPADMRDMEGDDAPETGVSNPDQRVRQDMEGDDAPETGVDNSDAGEADLGGMVVTGSNTDDCAQAPRGSGRGWPWLLLALVGWRRRP